MILQVFNRMQRSMVWNKIQNTGSVAYREKRRLPQTGRHRRAETLQERDVDMFTGQKSEKEQTTKHSSHTSANVTDYTTKIKTLEI